MASIFSRQAVEAGNWKACVAAEVISEASRSSASALFNYGNVIPEVSVDVSECLALNPDFEPGTDSEEFATVITTLITSVLETAQLVSERLTDEDQCGTLAYIVGALEYVKAATGPIVSEVTSPDGVIVLPEVSFDFTGCTTEE